MPNLSNVLERFLRNVKYSTIFSRYLCRKQTCTLCNQADRQRLAALSPQRAFCNINSISFGDCGREQRMWTLIPAQTSNMFPMYSNKLKRQYHWF